MHQHEFNSSFGTHAFVVQLVDDHGQRGRHWYREQRAGEPEQLIAGQEGFQYHERVEFHRLSHHACHARHNDVALELGPDEREHRRQDTDGRPSDKTKHDRWHRRDERPNARYELRHRPDQSQQRGARNADQPQSDARPAVAPTLALAPGVALTAFVIAVNMVDQVYP